MKKKFHGKPAKGDEMRTRWLVWVVIAIYAVSFVLPVYSSRNEPGVSVFVSGLYALPFAPVMFILWLANPAFWCGAYFCAREQWSKAVWAGTGASLLALSFIPCAGAFGSLGLGYYVWLASMVLLTGVALIGLLRPSGQGADG